MLLALHFPSLLRDDAAEQVPDLSYLWPLAPSWILSIRGQWTPLLTFLLRIEFIGSKPAARMDFSPFTSPFCHGIYSRPLLDVLPNQCSIVPVIIYCPGVSLCWWQWILLYDRLPVDRATVLAWRQINFIRRPVLTRYGPAKASYRRAGSIEYGRM